MPRLLAGPPFDAGPESWAQHRARLGDLPAASLDSGIIPSIERSGLIGRGGGGFSVGGEGGRGGGGAPRGGGGVGKGGGGGAHSREERAPLHPRPPLIITRGGALRPGGWG